MSDMHNVDEGIINTAERIFQVLIDSTDSPGEAATILVYLHTKLWLSAKGSVSMEEMLADYCASIRHNVALNEASLQ